MGQSHATQFSDESLKKFQLHYTFTKEIKDERWGIVQVWTEKTTKAQVMIVSKSLHNDLEYKEFLNQLHLRAGSPNPNLLNFIGWSNENKDGLCGHARKVDLYTQYLSQNLSKEISRRAEKKELFEENEIWYLARTAIAVGLDFQQRGIYHGDYRPNQILLTDDTNDGLIHLTDNGLIGLYRNNYVMTLSGAAKGYLSPELMTFYARKEANPEYDVYRSDVYSLGITLLQAATLKDPNHHFYDWVAHQVLHKNIQRSLTDLESQYSLGLVRLIRWMLDEDEPQRPDFRLLANQAVPVQQPVYVAPVQPVQFPVTYVSSPPVQTYVQPPVQTYVQPPVQTYVQPPVQTYVQPPINPISYSQAPIYSSGYSLPPQGQYSGIRYVPVNSPQKGHVYEPNAGAGDLSDLDRRVQEAIRTTEETINRNSQAPNLASNQGGQDQKLEDLLEGKGN